MSTTPDGRDGPLRVAVVDDHPMFRMGLAAALGEMDGIVLVGEAGERRLARRTHDDDGDEQGRQDEPLVHEALLSRAGG